MAMALTVQERQRAVFTVLLVAPTLFLFGFSTVVVSDRRRILSQVTSKFCPGIVLFNCHFLMKRMKFCFIKNPHIHIKMYNDLLSALFCTFLPLY